MKALKDAVEEIERYTRLMQPKTRRRFDGVRSKVLRGRSPSNQESCFIHGLLRIVRSPIRDRIFRGELQRARAKYANIKGLDRCR